MNQPFKTRYVTYLTALLLLIPLSAAAQDEAGFYASAYGGVPAAPSTSFSEFRPTGPGVGGTAKFGGGLGFGAAVGRRFGNGWAVELALDERGNYLRRVGGVEVDGNIFSELVLLNAYYRFPARGALRPFIGAGLGYVMALDIDVDRNGSEQNIHVKAAWVYKPSWASSTAWHPAGASLAMRAGLVSRVAHSRHLMPAIC